MRHPSIRDKQPTLRLGFVGTDSSLEFEDASDRRGRHAFAGEFGRFGKGLEIASRVTPLVAGRAGTRLLRGVLEPANCLCVDTEKIGGDSDGV